jgi:hypothetical protein
VKASNIPDDLFLEGIRELSGSGKTWVVDCRAEHYMVKDCGA